MKTRDIFPQIPTPAKSSSFRLGRSLLLAAGAASLMALLTPASHAATYTWDSDGAATSAIGGTGTWDTTSSLWRTGVTLGTFPNTTPSTDTVWLVGNAGTVTIAPSTSINLNVLNLGPAGYTIAGDNTAALNMEGVTPTIGMLYSSSASQSISAIITGSAGLTKGPGTGSLTLAGACTYTGTTFIQNGSLVLDMNAGGSLNPASSIAFGGLVGTGGSFVVKGKDNVVSSQTLNDVIIGGSGFSGDLYTQIKLLPGTSGTLNLTLSGANWNPQQNSTMNIDLSAGNVTLTSSPAMNNSIVSGVNTAKAGWVTVTDTTGTTGFATVTGGKVVRYTGATALAVSSGTVSNSFLNYVTKPGVDAAYTSGTFTVPNANLFVNTLSIDTAAGSGALDLTVSGSLNFRSRAILMTGSNNYAIQNGALSNNGTLLIVHQYGTGDLTISSTLGLGASRLAKDGPGLLCLTGSNVFISTTSVAGGTLRADDGVGLSFTSQLELSNGVFETGTDFTRPTSTSVTSNNTRSVLINDGTTGFSAYGGPVNVNLSGTTLASVATVNWGSSSFNPTVFVLNASTANNTINLANGLTIDLNGAMRTFAVNSVGGMSTAAMISGTIKDFIGGVSPGGITKIGVGTLILSNNADTYTGATNVAAGTLVVSGSLTGTTTVSVSAGANLTVNGGINTASTTTVNGMLQGTGTLGLVTMASGTLAPGNGIGTINTRNLSLSGSSHLSIELGRTVAGAGTLSNDQVSVTGTVSLTSGADLQLSIASGQFNPIIGDLLTLVNNDSTDAVTGAAAFTKLNGVTTTLTQDSVFTFNAVDYQISYVGGTGNDITLLVVPEPGTWAMMLSGLGMLVGMQRMRRRSSK